MRKLKIFIILLFAEILLINGCSYTTTQKNITTIYDFQETGKEELKVSFIDVGQGDSVLLEYNNHCMLIDAGDNSEEEFIVEYLASKNIDTIDYIIGTHPHAHHIGGLDTVIDNFEIKNIYMPNVTTDTKTFEDVLASIENKNLSIMEPIAGTEFMFYDITIEILAPSIEYDDINNNSIILKIIYDNISFLLTGDAEEMAEYDILNLGYTVSADVLKVGHHGSDTSTSDKFLDEVNPTYSVISCGKNNRYGHPHKETVQKFQIRNKKMFRIDESGTVTFSTDGENLEIVTEK